MRGIAVKASVHTLVDLLQLRADQHGDEVLYRFLESGDVGGRVSTWTYREVDLRARAIATTLREAGMTGERALLLFAPGLDFVSAFFGALYAGAVAVPAYPPDPQRLDRTLPRLQHIIEDCGARCVLTTADLCAMAPLMFAQVPSLATLRWIAVDATTAGASGAWTPPRLTGEDLAFLQYTSGSTGMPRGVQVTHGNVLHNSGLIYRAFGHSDATVGVIWLPMFHDMGLIGGVIQPLYGGFPVALMSPLAFLHRPMRWLEAISQLGATTSGGPNFAYDLCARRATDDEIARLDLRSWSLAFNGAEPVRAETLARFARRFAPCGFRPEAMYPCYGLAEATLLVSGGRHGEAAVVADAAANGAAAQPRVSSGVARDDLRVVIVDRATGAPCPAGAVGEILVAGPSVAAGYWGRSEDTAATFGAAGEPGYLRTGDLGMLRDDGELFIVGRAKDLIILRGRNLYPQDLEATAEAAHPAVRPGCVAAFGVEVEGEERVVLAAEVDVHKAEGDVARVAHAIRGALGDGHGVQAHAIVLVAPRGIPKTSSGKLQRRACRDEFLAGTLAALVTSRLDIAAADAPAIPPRLAMVDVALRAALARRTGVAADQIAGTATLLGLGLDSLGVSELAAELAAMLGVPLSVARLWEHPTVSGAAAAIAAAWSDATAGDRTAEPALAGAPHDDALSHGELALWFECKLAPNPAAYHAASAFTLCDRPDVEALQRALGQLVAHHAGLRTTFAEVDGLPRRRIHAAIALPVSVADAEGWARTKLDARIAELIRRPFDLARGPLIRAAIFAVEPDTVVLVVTVHHLIADFWSQELCLRDLQVLYDAERAGRTAALAPGTASSSVARQRAWLASEGGQRMFAHWERRLAGCTAALDLPIDHARPAVRGYGAATVRFGLPAALSDQVRSTARGHGATAFSVWLAAYELLLHRYTGQADLLVGTPAACRELTERDTVGYFVNVLPLRSQLRAEQPFGRLVAETQAIVSDALAHSALPFDRLVDRLALPRDPARAPLVQAGFVLHQPRVDHRAWREQPLDQPGSPFELMLTLVDDGRAVTAFFTYDPELFARATIERAANHYLALLTAATADPARTAFDLVSTIAPSQHPQIRELHPRCLHDAFAAQAAQTPTAVAVTAGDQHVTYAELDRRANRVAHHLRTQGVGVGAVVGLCVERSIDGLVGVLGILKAGAAYLPLSRHLPALRIARLIDDAQAQLIVTQDALTGVLPDGVPRVCLDADHAVIAAQPATAPTVAVTPDDLAYIIFTSGSTGRPKGVAVEHRQASALIEATSTSFGFGPSDVWSLFSSLSFDVSVWEIWGALLHGGRLVVVPYDVARSPMEFHGLLARERVTVLNQVSSAFRLLVDAEDRGQVTGELALRYVIFAGEPLDRQSVARWGQRHGYDRPVLVNMYGITETCVHATARRLAAADVEGAPRQPIGLPLAHLDIQICGPDGEPVPLGARGEIYVGGAGVARGYLRNPITTAERFVPDPDHRGERRYRSGDLGRVLPDGELEFLGRIDYQVQVRGHRVEPGEIEAALRAYDGIRDAVVVGWGPDRANAAAGDAAGVARLLAYVELPGEPPASDALRAFLAERLPAYAIPSAFVMVAQLPRTSGGKPDRRALPPPPHARPELTQAFVAPASELERTMAGVWGEVLALDQIGAEDDFFALGGDSIHSLQVVSRCRALGIAVSVGQLFRAPRIRALCRVVGGATTEVETLAPFALVDAGVRARVPSDVVDAYPASMLQAVLIHHSTTSPAYEVYVSSFLVRAPFSPAALGHAVDDLAAKHAMLRTSFAVSPLHEHLQLVHARVEVPVVCDDLIAMAAPARDEVIARWLDAERRRAFDWTVAPLFRVHVHRCTADTFRVTLSEPFLDGWSVASLVSELLERYHAHRTATPLRDEPPPASYAWFVRREREAIAAGRAFWAARIRELPDGALPAPPVRAASTASGTRRRAIEIDNGVVEALGALGRGHGVALKHLLLAAHLRVVGYLCGRNDVVTGVMINTRPDVAGADRMLGMFLNTLPLAVELAGETGLGLARAALAWEAEVLAHRFTPLAELRRERADRPLFEIAFNYTHFHAFRSVEALDGMAVLDWLASDQTYFPLAAQFNFDLFTQTLRLALDYDPDRIDDDLVARIIGFYRQALADLAAAPERAVLHHALIDRHEGAALLALAGEPEVEEARAPATIHAMFEAQVARTPDAIAVITSDARVSFAELEARANQLAHHLRGCGATPEARIAVLLDRSLELVVALLAILKAGAAYVPLEIAYPSERIAFALADAGVSLVVSDARAAAKLAGFAGRVIRIDAEREAIARLAIAPPVHSAGELAYVLYTSGSTGTPKGVMGLHRGAVNRMRWLEARFPFAPGDVACAKTSPAFVDSVWEAFGPLCAGVPLVVVGDDTARDAAALGAAIARFAVTHLVVVPSLLRVLLDVVPGRDLASLRLCISSGEALPVGLVRTFAARLPGTTLINLYGSSEVAADVTWHVAADEPAEIVPCGRPIAQTRIYVLDRELAPVPRGFVGEIYVGGAGLARGYHARPAWTAERFVPDPFSSRPGDRLYRTGDRGCWRDDGVLEFHGRFDHQVKIRGHRVELDEVAHALGRHPGVAHGVAHTWRDGDGALQLVGYVVAAGGHGVDGETIRGALARQLPSALVPDAVIVLDRLPLTPSGKLDRTRLPSPVEIRRAVPATTPPRTPTEHAIAAIWRDLLGVETIGIDDSFLALGGHSLLANRMLARVREALAVQLPLRAVFDAPTIGKLAAVADAARAGGGPVAAPVAWPRVTRDGALPLSVAQRSLWFQSQLAPDSAVYNMPASVRLRGALDVEALAAALSEVTMRHEVLRMVIRATDGKPFGELRDDAGAPLAIERAEAAEPERPVAMVALAEAEARAPFDLATAWPIRVRLVRFAPTDHLLLVTLHHIAGDGWSLGVLIREINELYAAHRGHRVAALPAQALDYVDVAAAEAARLRSGALDAQLAYWKRRLDAAPPLVTVPPDRERRDRPSFTGAQRSFAWPAELSAQLRDLARASDATLFAVVVAAFDTVLGFHAGLDDVVIGTDFALRDHPALEAIVGLLVNQSAIRVSLAGAPRFDEVVARAAASVIDALEHKDVPFATVVDARRATRHTAAPPVFQVKLVLQTQALPAWALPGLEVSVVAVDTGTAKFDLLWNLWDAASGIHGIVEYDSDLYDATTVQRVIDDFALVVAGVANEPQSSLPVITGWLQRARDDAHRRLTVRDRDALKATRPQAIAIDLDEEA